MSFSLWVSIHTFLVHMFALSLFLSFSGCSKKKLAVISITFPLYIVYLFFFLSGCFRIFLFIFGFQQFDYEMTGCSFCIYPAWFSLSILNLKVSCFCCCYQIWGPFGHYSVWRVFWAIYLVWSHSFCSLLLGFQSHVH